MEPSKINNQNEGIPYRNKEEEYHFRTLYMAQDQIASINNYSKDNN